MQYHLKIHPVKCDLYFRKIRWCGRILSKEGIRFDSRRIDDIRDTHESASGGELQKFVYATQWMHSAIPMFKTIIRLLSDFMESLYVKASSRKEAAVARVTLHQAGWSETELDTFQRAMSALEHQVIHAHCDSNCLLCVFADASDFLWSGIVT